MNYVLDCHTHTIVSGHAYNTMKEMVQSAADKGLQLLGITEHAPSMPGTCHEFYFQNLRVVPRQMFGVELMLGVELNILDEKGHVDLNPRVLSRMDIAIASIHNPCFCPGNMEQITAAYLNVMKNPMVHVIGHPDDARFMSNYDMLVRGAREHGVMIEINNSSLSPNCMRQNGWENIERLMRLCMHYEVPMLIGSDAHVENDVGNHQYADELIERIGFPEELIVNRSVDVLKKIIEKRKNM